MKVGTLNIEDRYFLNTTLSGDYYCNYTMREPDKTHQIINVIDSEIVAE